MAGVEHCQALAREGRVTEALRGFDAALMECPDDIAALGGRAACLLALGQALDAYDNYRQLAQRAAHALALRAVSAAIMSLQYTHELEEQFVIGATLDLAARFGSPGPQQSFSEPFAQSLS